MPDEQREPTQARVESIQALRDMREDWQWCADEQERMDAIKRGCLRNIEALDVAIAALEPASPSEQTPTRVELRAAYEAGFEASGEGWNGEYLGPKVEYPACLDKGFAEWLSEQPASAPSEQREGEARVDLAERLEKIADRLDGYAERYPYELGGATLMDEAEAVREAASTIDHQTKALEAADELAKVAAFAPVTRTARVAYRSARATSTKEDG